MELRVLRYFLTVAREESITAAANSLHISQPTLSRQLMDLEQELGKPLFIRGNRKISLTKDGYLLRQRAEDILSLVDKTAADIAATDEYVAGELQLACGESAAMQLIARTFNQLHQAWPNIIFHIHTLSGSYVDDLLDKGILDFAMVLMISDLQKYDYIQLPHTEHWGVLIQADHPLATKGYVTPQDIRPLPLILPRRELTKSELSGWAHTQFEKLNVIGYYNLLFNASILVENGFGCTLCISNLINAATNPNLKFLPLKPAMLTTIYLIWKKHRVFSKPAEKFLQQLQENLDTLNQD